MQHCCNRIHVLQRNLHSLLVIGTRCTALRLLEFEYHEPANDGAAPPSEQELRAEGAAVDAAVAAVAAGCGGTLERLALRGFGRMRDRAVLALAEGCGGGLLRSLSLNGAAALTDSALLALAAHCGAGLRDLDLSWCRRLTDEGLGLLTDRTPALARLELWGCSRLTPVFLEGHVLPALRIVGRPSRPPAA